MKAAAATGVGLSGLTAISGSVTAAVGDSLGTVDLDNSGDGVGLTFTGEYILVPDGFSTDTIHIYEPVQSGSAPLVSTKIVEDSSGNPLSLNAIEWDPTRDKLWGADYRSQGPVYLIDIGDPTVSDTVTGTHQFDANHPQGTFVDGLAFDADSDTLWYSPDVRPDVYEYNLDGTVASQVTPELPDGNPIDRVSGLAVGADLGGRRTLYVGENQDVANGNVRRVYADDGVHISDFTVATEIRVEDLACNPNTYDSEAILVKHAYTKDNTSPGQSGHTVYRAFEVEEGTCPLPGCDSEVTVDLIADGGSEATAEKIGTITVEDLNGEIAVTYSLMDDWFLRETHLHIAGDEDGNGSGDCDRIPQTGKGNPKVGHFGLAREYGSGVTEDTYVIDQDNNVFDEVFDDDEALCIAAHAAVFQDMNDNEAFDPDVDREETAWGEGDRFVERGNWAMHFEYQNPCA